MVWIGTWNRNRRLLFLCLGAVLFLLLTGCHGVRTPPPVPTPTTAPVPTWRGIVPGVSTEEEVVQILGEPEEKRVYDDGQVWYSYPAYLGGMRSVPHYIVFHNGRVRLIWSVVDVLEPSLHLYLEQYGEPEKVTWAHPARFPYTRIFIFARHGVAVVAENRELPSEARVFEVWCFVPTTLNEFLSEVAPFIPDSDPTGGQDPYP